MALTEQEKKRLAQDLFDPEKVNVHCDKHMYFGPGKLGFGTQATQVPPHKGCPDCWTVFYFVEIAQTPAGERQAKLDELEYVVKNLVSLADKGKLDLTLDEHPKVQIFKEGTPEHAVMLTDQEE